jgi:hypothetical protein
MSQSAAGIENTTPVQAASELPPISARDPLERLTSILAGIAERLERRIEEEAGREAA